MKALALAALSATSLVGAPALAADFTFEVPVRIENVVRGDVAIIECFVSVQPTTGLQRASAENVIGRVFKTVPLSGGAYRGAVVIEVNIAAPRRASEGKSYTCYIKSIAMKPASGTGPGSAVSPDNAESSYAAATGMQVDTMTMRATGPLP